MALYSGRSPATFSDSLPKGTDVVVIGAGVVGISIAWFLAMRGVSVVVCEKGRVAGEQSSRNWGWIRQHGRDYAELPIMMESIDLWESMAAELDVDIGFTRNGVMYLAKDAVELAKREAWLAVAKSHRLDTHMLTAKQVGRFIEGNPGNWVGAAYTPSDGCAEPSLAVPALARAVQKMGVRIRENCAGQSLDIHAGAVSGVLTEAGLIKCDAVVCAGGAWASQFSRLHGCEFPQLSVRATAVRTAPAPAVYSGNAASGKLAFRRRQDGGYTLAAIGYSDHFISRDSVRYAKSFLPCYAKSKKNMVLRLGGVFPGLQKIPRWKGGSSYAFECVRTLNPDPSRVAIEAIKRRLAQELPPLAGIPIEQAWAGMIDVTPDIVPVMDAVDALPGYYIAAGFCGHGFGIGPGAGRVMADMIVGKPIGHDISRFCFARFGDRNHKLELGPAL